MTEAVLDKDAQSFGELPQPEGSLVLGHLSSFREDFLGAFIDAARDHGDRVRFRFFYQKALLLRHPEDIYHVLLQNQRNYLKQTRGYRAMRYLIGNGLVTSEGDFWLRQRRIAQPSFHPRRVTGFGEAMVRAVDKKVQAWDARQDSEIDLNEEMMEVALDIVGQTLLSTDLTGTTGTVGPALDFVLHDVLQRANSLLFEPLWVPTPHNRKVRKAIAVLVDMVDEIIAQRRAQPSEGPPDLLTMLMDARDEDSGEGMSDEQLRDEVMTIFLAGHETTATAMTWTFYLLASHPEIEARLHEELDQVLEDGRLPTVEDLRKLEWTRMIVDESMRLYPPVPIVARMSQEDDIIGGYKVPADTFVFVAPYLTHRHPDFWPDPERFDPERFRERRAGRPRFAYFPFLGGPRQCIGNNFALMEARLILATIASRYRLHLIDDKPKGLDVTITLRPDGGMPMRLEKR